MLLAAAMVSASATAAAQPATEGAVEGLDQAEATVTDSTETALTTTSSTDDAAASEDAAPQDAAPAATEERARRQRGAAPASVAAPTAAASESATATASSTDAWRRITEAELAVPTSSYPYVEFHGYFRTRIDNFWNLDLATSGTSSQLPPLEAFLNGTTHNNGAIGQIPEEIVVGDGSTIDLRSYSRDRSEYVSSANMRFRLEPTFHIAQSASIHMTLDILDNVVLGSQGIGNDNPLNFWTDSSSAREFGREAVDVRAVWGEMRSFLGTFRVGRMPNHWGLGMMFNNGGEYASIRQPRLSYRGLGAAGNTCIDCDNGDYVDRISFTTSVFDHHITLAYDYNLSGATQGVNDAFGQPRDMGQFDDTRSFVLSVARRPESPEEIARRNRKLSEQGRPVFDYGAYLMYRMQRIDGQECTDNGDPTTCNFVPRGAKMFVPNLWFRLEHQPGFRRHLRIEGELAGVVGNMDFAAPSLVGLADSDVDRKIRQVAGALEFEYTNFAYALGFNAGFASGRETGGTPGLGANYDTDMSADRRFTAFFFDRDYFVDMIMFREVIGTVTNALYLNPFFQYDLFSKRADSLGLRLDLITAVAANAAATPSGKGFYGVEANLGAYYRAPRFGADISGGIFLPGNAFDAVEGRPRTANYDSYLGGSVGSTYLSGESKRAKPATTVQARFYWAF